LLWGSDYPLPAIGWLTSAGRLARDGLLAEDDAAPLERLQSLNPMAFDFALKRSIRHAGRAFDVGVFETRTSLQG
jgi:hypothetical protein